MSKITVTVQMGRWPGRDEETVCIDLDDYLVDELCSPIKSSDGVFPMFDTPPEVAYRVRRMRANVAQGLAKDMTKALLAAFEKRDTFNGYTREENAAFYAPTSAKRAQPEALQAIDGSEAAGQGEQSQSQSTAHQSRGTV